MKVEVNAGYQLIKNTFTQLDTCKLHELEAIRLPPFGIPVKKGSKYRELIRQRLVRQQEVGIIRRFNKIWIAQKPMCESGILTFTSVGVTELRYAYIYIVAGYVVALLLVGGEIVWQKWFHWNHEGIEVRTKEQQATKSMIGEKNGCTFLN